MPQLSTQHATVHTVTLTDFELESLREAARVALAHTDACVYTSDWQALRQLGLPATRDTESFVDTHTNPRMIG